MLAFWVFIPGPVLLVLAMLYFNWRQRKHQPALSEKTSEE